MPDEIQEAYEHGIDLFDWNKPRPEIDLKDSLSKVVQDGYDWARDDHERGNVVEYMGDEAYEVPDSEIRIFRGQNILE